MDQIAMAQNLLIDRILLVERSVVLMVQDFVVEYFLILTDLMVLIVQIAMELKLLVVL